MLFVLTWLSWVCLSWWLWGVLCCVRCEVLCEVWGVVRGVRCEVYCVVWGVRCVVLWIWSNKGLSISKFIRPPDWYYLERLPCYSSFTFFFFTESFKVKFHINFRIMDFQYGFSAENPLVKKFLSSSKKYSEIYL